MSDKEIAVKVDHVSKYFKLPTEATHSLRTALVNRFKGIKGYREQHVLKDISFDVYKGDFFGIVGRNGSGKSTLLKIISQIYVPEKGSVTVNGKMVSFIELGVGFNPELTGRENVYMNGAMLGFTTEEIDAMYGMKLEGMEEMVRDVFLLGYFSCQRYSDYSKLREENFITYDTGLGVISLTQKKTGNVVNVPIVDKRVNELCEKYHYDFPVLTEQQMNVKIKVVAEKLSKDVPSLQEKFVTVLTAVERRAEDTYAKLLKKKKSGKKLTENERKWYYKQHKLAESHNGNPLWERNKHGEVIRPKYELVSSHTSRRSGTTNLYKMGVLSSKEMRSITGHQSEKVFEKYIRVGISEQAQIVADKLLAAKKAKNGKVEK